MRTKVEKSIKDILQHQNFEEDDYSIFFGYDCVSVEICRERQEFDSDLIDNIRNKFNVEHIGIYVLNGRLVLSWDISKCIIAEYGSWEYYEMVVEI